MNIKSPGEFFEGLLGKIPARQRLAFLSTIIIGFCCHLYVFTNSMYNSDDIRYLYVTFDKPELGRWLQTYAAGISSYFSLPVINGLLALFYAAVASMLITAVLDIKSKINIVLTGGLLVTFPTMACLYSFMFAADPFMLSCALACGAAWFVTKGRGRLSWLAGAVFLCLSVGIYQAYLPFTLLLMLLYYILILAENQTDKKQLIAKGLRYIAMLAVGMGAYYIGMEATLKIKDISLSDYQGVGDSSFPGPSQLISRMHTAIIDFKEFFSGNQVLALNGWLKAALIITIVIIIAGFLIIAVYSGMFKEPVKVILLIVCGVCIPFSVNVIWLISDSVNYHMLMRHAWCLLFIAAIVIGERAALVLKNHGAAAGKKYSASALLNWVLFIAMFLVVWNYMLLSNIGYFNMNFRYEKTYALCLKIVDRLEAMEDYDRDRPMAFVGRYSKTYTMDEVTFLLEPMAGMKGDRVFADSSRCYLPFFQNCLGEDIEVVDREREEAFREDPRFIEMPRFPHEGSIKVIDDVTVIKLNE